MGSSSGNSVLVDRQARDGVALVTLNRPEVLNAVNTEMAQLLERTFRELDLDTDDEIRAVVITGAGGRAFSTGADIKERLGLSSREIASQRCMLLAAFSAVASCRRPIIAAVDGYALGGGFELALLCDFIVAGQGARFGLPEVTRGLIPGAGGTQTLARLIGKAAAKYMIFTGAAIDATEAFRLGIVTRLAPDGEALTEALAIAEAVSRNAPLAVIQAKRAIDVGAEVDLRSGLAFELEAYNACLGTEDREEGIRAFSERRAPVFRGR